MTCGCPHSLTAKGYAGIMYAFRNVIMWIPNAFVCFFLLAKMTPFCYNKHICAKWGMLMKHKTLWIRITAVACGLLLTVVGIAGVFAEDVPVVTQEEVVTAAPIVTDPVTDPPMWTESPTQAPTFPPTQPPTQPPVATTAQTVITEPPAQQETTRTQTPTENAGGNLDDNSSRPQATEFVPPTIPKTVSEKSYTTNYAAGIISWICVIVGLIVIFAVAASTKLSAFRTRGRT